MRGTSRTRQGRPVVSRAIRRNRSIATVSAFIPHPRPLSRRERGGEEGACPGPSGHDSGPTTNQLVVGSSIQADEAARRHGRARNFDSLVHEESKAVDSSIQGAASLARRCGPLPVPNAMPNAPIRRRIGGWPCCTSPTFTAASTASRRSPARRSPSRRGRSPASSARTAPARRPCSTSSRGLIAPDEGRVELDGRDIAGEPAEAITRRGLVRTFQIARGFPRLTVMENLLLYGTDQPGERIGDALFGFARARRRERDLVRRAAGDRRTTLPDPGPGPPRRRDLGRPEEAAGARAGADDGPEDDPPRRAGRGGEPDPGREPCRTSPRAPRRRPYPARDRARHEPDRQALRSGGRARGTA